MFDGDSDVRVAQIEKVIFIDQNSIRRPTILKACLLQCLWTWMSSNDVLVARHRFFHTRECQSSEFVRGSLFRGQF